MTTTINNETITVFELTGKDVPTFLNNQVVTAIGTSPEPIKFTAICNPKGRITYTLIMQQQTDATYIAVATSLSDNFFQFVNMRRFRMEVNIRQSNLKLTINSSTDHPKLIDDVAFSDDPELPITDTNDFWLFMFKAGLPWIIAETTEQFIPQHLNLDQLGAIDFDKGCYPGQEIVARLHFLGKVKKRMQYIQYQAATPVRITDTTQLSEFEQKMEFCSPSIRHQGEWHAQAVSACKT